VETKQATPTLPFRASQELGQRFPTDSLFPAQKTAQEQGNRVEWRLTASIDGRIRQCQQLAPEERKVDQMESDVEIAHHSQTLGIRQCSPARVGIPTQRTKVEWFRNLDLAWKMQRQFLQQIVYAKRASESFHIRSQFPGCLLSPFVLFDLCLLCSREFATQRHDPLLSAPSTRM
jgi:hypothetical protein